MKYLILGSAGQIGSALTEFVEKQGHTAIRFDLVHDDTHDLRHHENTHLDKAMKEADYVFFLAFDVGGSRYLKKYQNTYDFVSNNVKLMNTTFEMLKKHNKKFIFASSQMSNMGSHSNYGLLKALGEAYTRTLGGIVVKFWNVYGIEHDLEKSHVITDFIIKARDNKKIDLLTDGTEERQFLFSDDCSECLVALSQKDIEVPRDQELHITNFEWTTVLEIADIVAKHFPGTVIIPAKATDEVQMNKRNEPNPYILNHWKPRTKIHEGIEKVVKHMNGNK